MTLSPTIPPVAPPDPLGGLLRPRLLIRAARCGLGDYRRERDLPRLLHETEPPLPGKALPRLIATEQGMETCRSSGSAAYSLPHHIEVLIALLAEARLSRAILPGV